MPNYSKRDYEAFAKLCRTAVADAYTLGHYEELNGIIALTARIRDLFADDNQRFDTGSFWQAAVCDVTGWPSKE